MTKFKKGLAIARTERQFSNKIIHGKCVDVMQQMPAESVDLVITDANKSPAWLKSVYTQI